MGNVRALRARLRAPFGLILALAAAGCMDEPRNGKVLPNAAAPITFSGYLRSASERAYFQLRDQRSSNTWVDIGSTLSTTIENLDATGVPWYKFSRTVTLPFSISTGDTKYWKRATSVGNQRRMQIQARGRSQIDGLLNAFDVSDQNCLESTLQTGSGYDAISACNPEMNAVATMYLNCGKQDQACCLGNDLTSVEWCDTGWVCDTAIKTCKIPTGGIDQPCNVGGASQCNAPPPGHTVACLSGGAPEPSPGMCRDMTIEHAPVLTTDVVIHTCSSTASGSTADKWVALRKDYSFDYSYVGRWIPVHNMFWMDKPGDEPLINSVETYGVRLPNIRELGDIKTIVIGTGGDHADDRWCFDQVSLLVNGVQVFTKNFPNGVNLDSAGNIVFSVASTSELRQSFSKLNRASLCALPTTFTYAQLQRQITGLLGDTMIRNRLLDTITLPDAPDFSMGWGSGGGVTVTRLSDSVAKASMQFRVKEHQIADFEATAKVDIQLGMSCNYEYTGIYTLPAGQTNATLTVDSCTTDFTSPAVVSSVSAEADTWIPGVKLIIETFARGAVRKAATEQLTDFATIGTLFTDSQESVCQALDNTPLQQLCGEDNMVCGCPGIAFDNSAIRMDWSDYGPYEIDLGSSLFSDVLCLR